MHIFLSKVTRQHPPILCGFVWNPSSWGRSIWRHLPKCNFRSSSQTDNNNTAAIKVICKLIILIIIHKLASMNIMVYMLCSIVLSLIIITTSITLFAFNYWLCSCLLSHLFCPSNSFLVRRLLHSCRRLVVVWFTLIPSTVKPPILFCCVSAVSSTCVCCLLLMGGQQSFQSYLHLIKTAPLIRETTVCDTFIYFSSGRGGLFSHIIVEECVVLRVAVDVQWCEDTLRAALMVGDNVRRALVYLWSF